MRRRRQPLHHCAWTDIFRSCFYHLFCDVTAYSENLCFLKNSVYFLPKLPQPIWGETKADFLWRSSENNTAIVHYVSRMTQELWFIWHSKQRLFTSFSWGSCNVKMKGNIIQLMHLLIWRSKRGGEVGMWLCWSATLTILVKNIVLIVFHFQLNWIAASSTRLSLGWNPTSSNVTSYGLFNSFFLSTKGHQSHSVVSGECSMGVTSLWLNYPFKRVRHLS